MNRRGIKHQVLMLALVPTIVTSVLLGAYFTSTRIHDLEQTFRERGEAIALRLASASETAVVSRSKILLQNLAELSMSEHEVQSVGFYSENGEEIASHGKTAFSFKVPSPNQSLVSQIFLQEEENALGFIVPITNNKEILIGWIKLELETKSIRIREDAILMNAGLICLLGLIISGLLAYRMGRNVTRPILELAQAVERIKEGDLNAKIKLSGYRELRILESGINMMTQSLQDAHSQLQHKIDTATANLRRSLETIEMQNFELGVARRTAEAANQIKSEFLADMSHEVRTPLNAVIGFIHLLQKTKLSDKQKDYLQTIQKSSTHLLSLINDILDFSKIEAGKLLIERSLVSIRDCVTETLSLLEPHASEKNIQLVPLIYSDVPNLIYSDALRIKQIITNLISNSIKFTEQGNVVLRVMLERETAGQAFIRVSVTDTGIGLSASDQKQLFIAFNQVKQNSPRNPGGTGLGLVICKKLVEQMKGTIGLESELGVGSTFWFTFEADKYIETETRTSTLSLVPKDYDSLPPSKILAVDDNADNLKLIMAFLEDMGMDVVAVDSGMKAIEEARENRFDLIFMDIRMPHINGIEATSAIRHYEKTSNLSPTPIVALTAHALVSEREALLNAGIDDCLTKPIDIKALKAVLHKWTQSKKESSKMINWDLAQQLAGGKKDLAIELMQGLLKTLPIEKQKINDAFNRKAYSELRDIVHRLHGACCYCGVPELKTRVKNLEKTATSRKHELIKPKLEALNHTIDELLMESIDLVAV